MAQSIRKKHSLVNLSKGIITFGWMVAPQDDGGLDLKGTEATVYAIIYGFSQAPDTYFTGSLQYLADWAHCTRYHITTCLQSLQTKQLIFKYETIKNNIRFCSYKTNMKIVYSVLRRNSEVASDLYESTEVGSNNTLYNDTLEDDLNSLCNKVVHHTRKLHTVQESCTPVQESCTNNIVYNIDNNTSSYTNVYSEVGCERAPAVPAEPASPIKDTTASGATPLFTRQRKKSSAQFLIEKERAKGAQTSNEEKERTCAGVGVQARRQAGTHEAVAAVATPNERGASRETAMRNNLAKRFVEYCGAKWQRDLMSDELKDFGQKLFDWIYSCAHTYKFKMDEPVAKSLWAELDRYKQQYGVGTLMKVLQKATSQATRIYPTMFYEFTSSNSTRRERRFNDEDTTTPQITPNTKTSNIY